MPNNAIKDERVYKAIRREGASLEKAARIANASSNSSRSEVGRKGGKAAAYDDWSKQDLMKRAREIGIAGRSSMSKGELIKALRDR